MIELSGITKSFNSGEPNQFTAVDNVSLVVHPQRITVLKGPSGSGKTSLLTMIGCMARPTSGRIFLRGVAAAVPFQQEGMDSVEITSLPERFLNDIRRSTFGFIFQQFNLVKGISVLENVMLPAYPTGERRPDFRARALGLLEQFSISRHAGQRIELLSGGELQRVAIARALINNPAIIIADEPTAHLDSKLSQEFMAIVGRLKGEGKSVLIASHDPIVFDSPLIDRVVEMRDGAVVNSGSSR
ncbi:MAG: ABC transporter ATP-binding protein [Desulfuromonadaceae bacterium]|nr:ABC transporter ATP-binding protein [Desulfuromonadaceae bacterium]